MHPGPQRRRQPDIARDHEDQPPFPADPRQAVAEGRTISVGVVPQNHPGPPARQGGGGGARIGQAVGVGEQPQAREGR
jgi:hypothetical protein